MNVVSWSRSERYFERAWRNCRDGGVTVRHPRQNTSRDRALPKPPLGRKYRLERAEKTHRAASHLQLRQLIVVRRARLITVRHTDVALMVRGRGGRRSRVACARRRHGVIAHDALPLLVRPPDAARDQRRAERRARDASVAGRDRRERRRRGVAVRRFVFGRDGDAALRDVVDLDRSVELVRDRDVACKPLRHPLAPVAVADPDLNSPRSATTQRRRKKRR